MKRKIKKAAVIMAATMMTLGSGNPWIAHVSGSLPAPVESEAMTSPMMGTEYTAGTELLRTVDISPISVTIPSDGFELQTNPEAPFDVRENPGGQILCPDASILKVENHSAVPVCLEISEIAKMENGDAMFSGTFLGGLEQSLRLVDEISTVEDYGSTILVLGGTGMTYENEANFEQYATYPGKSGIRITDLEARESVGLQLCEKAMADFYKEYRFMVRLALKVSAVRANQARLV